MKLPKKSAIIFLFLGLVAGFVSIYQTRYLNVVENLIFELIGIALTYLIIEKYFKEIKEMRFFSLK